MGRLPNHLRGPTVTNEKCCPLCKTIEETTYRDWLPALQARRAHSLLAVTAWEHPFQ